MDSNVYGEAKALGQPQKKNQGGRLNFKNHKATRLRTVWCWLEAQNPTRLNSEEERNKGNTAEKGAF